MTIDKEIVFERKLADYYKDNHLKNEAKKHEQRAEWLEELKCYKNDNDFSDYADRLHKIAFNSGYNKAIDDFADKIISLCDDGEFMNRFNEFTATTILELSEQLKEGGE